MLVRGIKEFLHFCFSKDIPRKMEMKQHQNSEDVETFSLVIRSLQQTTYLLFFQLQAYLELAKCTYAKLYHFLPIRKLRVIWYHITVKFCRMISLEPLLSQLFTTFRLCTYSAENSVRGASKCISMWSRYHGMRNAKKVLFENYIHDFAVTGPCVAEILYVFKV